MTNQRLRFPLTVGVLVAVLCAGGVTTANAAESSSQSLPVMGPLNIGEGISADIDARTGAFNTEVPVASLPGFNGGGVTIGLSYRHDLAATGSDRSGVGVGWGWTESFVDVNGGVRVFPSSGGMFVADASQPSGLDGYVAENIVFSQEPGVLPARDEVGEVAYQFSLAYLGGITEYFNANGDLVTRATTFGARADWVWASEHRLLGVYDDAGSHAKVVWGESGASVFAPQRSDGVTPITRLRTVGQRLERVTNPVTESIDFRYTDTGLVNTIVTSSGAVTQLSYQTLRGGGSALHELSVKSGATGETVMFRTWNILGDRTPQGWPNYPDYQTLWGSGDGEFRYSTEMSNGPIRVVSEYNSLALLLHRYVALPSPSGDVTVRDETNEYPGTETGGVPHPQTLPKNYAQPTTTSQTFGNEKGGTRTVTEHTVFDNAGRLLHKVAADGTVTENVYDTENAPGMPLPIGHIREEKTTGTDGSVSQTINTLTPDHKSIVQTETFTGTAQLNTPDTAQETNASHTPDTASTSRTEMVVTPDGFVSQKKVIATSNPGGGPSTVITRYDRTFDPATPTYTLTQTNGADTSAAATTTTVVDTTTGLTVKECDPSGRTTTLTYDAVGRETQRTHPTGLQTTTEYFPSSSHTIGDPAKTDNSASTVTRVTTPNGVTRSEYHDVLGRITHITDNIQLISTDDPTRRPIATAVPGHERVNETRHYDDDNSSTVTDAFGLETTTVSDVFGRTTETITPSGLRHLTVYDDVAKKVSTGSTTSHTLTDAALISTSAYDILGRVTEHTAERSDGVHVPASTTTYDGLGRVVEQQSGDLSQNMTLNPDGTPQTTTISPLNPETFSGETVTTKREHNVLGKSTKKTLTSHGEKREGNTRVFDAAGQVISETNQTGKTTTYHYSVDGLLTDAHNGATGTVTHNTYDPVTRALTLIEVIPADGSTSRKACEYDQKTGEMIAVFDPDHADETRIRYRYDAFGNVIEIIYPNGKSVQHTFDENGRHTTTIDVAGNITQSVYNRLGQLSVVTQTSPPSAENLSDTNVLARITYDYDAWGRVVKLSRNNDLVTQYTFTSADEIATETTTHNGQLITKAAYIYDSHGNLTQRVDTSNTDPLPTTSTHAYTYNAYDQLTSSSLYDAGAPSGIPRTHTLYETNVSGAVTKETITTVSGEKNVRECEYNSLGQLISLTTNGIRAVQEYDLAGNLTRAADGTHYRYNVFNQPVTETRPDGSIVESTYWATGQHRSDTTRDTTGTNSVEIIWDGPTLINDIHTSETESVTASYAIGLSRHSRTLTHGSTYAPTPTPSTVSTTENPNPASPSTGETPDSAAMTNFYVTDRHHNTVAMVDTNGAFTSTYAYSDYGVPITTSSDSDAPSRTVTPTSSSNISTLPHPSSLHHNPFQFAGEYTTPTGTQYLAARVYNPQVMSFTTEDSAEQFDLYAYANANPITLSDPSGKAPNPDAAKVEILALLGPVLSVLGVVLAFVSAIKLPFYGPVVAGFSAVTALTDAGIAYTQFADHKNPDLLTNGEFSLLTYISMGLGVLSFGAAFGMASKVVEETGAAAIKASETAASNAKKITRIEGIIDEVEENMRNGIEPKIGKMGDPVLDSQLNHAKPGEKGSLISDFLTGLKELHSKYLAAEMAAKKEAAFHDWARIIISGAFVATVPTVIYFSDEARKKAVAANSYLSSRNSNSNSGSDSYTSSSSHVGGTLNQELLSSGF